MGIVAIIFILIFIAGLQLEYQSWSTTPYERQMKEWEKEQKRRYRLLNRAINKYNKNKPLKPDEFKVFKSYIRENLEKDPDDLSMLAIKEQIESNSIEITNTKRRNQTDFNEEYSKQVKDFFDKNIPEETRLVDDTTPKRKNRKLSEAFNKYCDCLTSKKFKYNPTIGREKELEQLMMSILTPGKSAIVIGQPRSW